jgi:hypothetical protein
VSGQVPTFRRNLLSASAVKIDSILLQMLVPTRKFIRRCSQNTDIDTKIIISFDISSHSVESNGNSEYVFDLRELYADSVCVFCNRH